MPGWEDTLFIITSDHGEGLNDHPSVPRSRFHGHLLYESQIQVPLIWYRPARRLARLPEPFGGIVRRFAPPRPEGRFNTPLRLLDLMPSLLEYLGIELPDTVDGISFASLLRGEGLKLERPAYYVAETYYRGADKIAVYGPEWKYIENRDGHQGTNPHELQRRGLREDGVRTDMIRERSEERIPRKRYLDDWEEKYVKAEPTGPVKGPSEEEIRQLRSLGYLK